LEIKQKYFPPRTLADLAHELTERQTTQTVSKSKNIFVRIHLDKFNFIFASRGDTTPPTPSVPTPPTSADIKVLVNGTAVSFDQPPIIQNGRTLVPLRAIFEALGATVDYEQSTQTLTAVRENVTVIMQIGNSVFTVNGNQKTLDVAPQIIGGRTLVPARAIAESFGAEVAWDQSTQTMTITMG